MTEPVSFDTLRAILVKAFEQLPDQRSGQNTQYTMCDAAMGAFSVFFMQSPSFLAYQRDMLRRRGHSNAGSLFGIARIPCDQQIRNLLDSVSPEHLREPYWTILEQLMSDPVIGAAFDTDGRWLCSLDGTQYFRSTEIHCPQCTVIHRDGDTSYAHTVLIPVLAKQGTREVLALEPEFIVPQDGANKQDCERNAARRWVQRNADHFDDQRLTILADDLHCNQPFCELLLEHHLDFILTCKPDSHTTLYEEIALLDDFGSVEKCQDRVWTGKEHHIWSYRFISQVPLRAPPHPLEINWCELTITLENTDEQLYHNTFVTNLPLTEETVRQVVAAGRTRWKVENEGNNVLKNRGYHLEHNYGHGKEHLSTVLIMLILLAFLCHTALQQCDNSYRLVRAELVTRTTFFNDLRALTRYHFFESWSELLRFMMERLEIPPD
jgi:hypothetical protein